jgi:hypothetical protein
MHRPVSLAALAAILALSVTGVAHAQGGPNKADAARQVDAWHQRKGYTIPYPHQVHLCSEYFDNSKAEVVDMMVQGSTATVKTKTSFVAKIEVRPGDWRGLNCYFPDGLPKWPAGNRYNLIETHMFQRWESGWRRMQ